MSNRRRKYAPSEREADFLFAFLYAGVIAIVGVLIGVVTLGVSRFQHKEPKDLLAPQIKRGSVSDFVRDVMGLSIVGKLALTIAVIAVLAEVINFFLIVYLWLFSVSVGSESNVIFFIVPLGGMLSLLVAMLVLQRSHIFEGELGHRTLFYDGTIPLVNNERINTVYTIRLPRGMDWNSERSIRFVEQLLYSFAPLLFRVSADDRSISWQVVDLHGRDPEMIENAIRISYPEADVRTAHLSEIEPLHHPQIYRLTLVYRSANPFVFPMKYASDVGDFDPLTSLVSSMNGLVEGERVSTNLFVVGEMADAQKHGERLLRRTTIKPTDYLSINGFRTISTLKSAGLDTVERYAPRDQKVLEEKLRHPLYQAAYIVQVDSPHKDRLLSLAQNLDSQMYGFSRSPYNSFCWHTGIPDGFPWRYLHRTPPDPETLIVELSEQDTMLTEGAIERIWEYAQSDEEKAARKATRLILGGEELALLWHIPDERFAASRIQWLSSRTVPPPTAVIHQEFSDNVLLGYGTSGGKLFPIHLPLKDREKHVRIIGKTGVGKSSLMYDLIMQDIHHGYGVAVIDPHGSLVENILETKLIAEEYERVVVLDLSDRISPPPLNPLRGGLGHVRVGQIVQSIESIYPDTKRYPRTSHYLRTALLTLNADPSATLKDVVRLFTDPVYRETLIRQVDDTELRGTWEEFDRTSDKEQRNITDPIRTRMSPFYSNPDLTPIMCHPDTLDFRAMMQQRKIILISLKMDEERVPETERDLIGALLLSRLQMSGMFEQGSVPYFVYIDEVQRFVTSSLDNMFAEARKFGLSLTVAHQYLEQLQDATQNAIIGNAGASIIFGCSPKDAQVFQPFTRPAFEPDDLVNLDQFTAVVKMQCDGVSQPAFTLLTPLPQVESPKYLVNIPVFRRRLELNPELMNTQSFKSLKSRKSHAISLRNLSRMEYTPKNRDEVNAWLRERYGQTVKLDDQTQFYDTDTSENYPASHIKSSPSEGSGAVTDD